MTLSPSEDRNITGVDGPKYELNTVCAVPGCGQSGRLERHHLWRKSDVIGDKWWVQIGDKLVGNCIGLCHHHHVAITDNICRIVFDGMVFTWKDPTLGSMELLWQPPSQVTDLEPRTYKINEDNSLGERVEHNHTDVPPGEVCPTCYRKVPVQKEKVEGPKLRKTWCIAVPEDLWEDGAEVLGTLLEEARKEMANAGLAYGEADVVKYHVLATVLGLFVQHSHKVLSDD